MTEPIGVPVQPAAGQPPAAAAARACGGAGRAEASCDDAFDQMVRRSAARADPAPPARDDAATAAGESGQPGTPAPAVTPPITSAAASAAAPGAADTAASGPAAGTPAPDGPRDGSPAGTGEAETPAPRKHAGDSDKGAPGRARRGVHDAATTPAGSGIRPKPAATSGADAAASAGRKLRGTSPGRADAQPPASPGVDATTAREDAVQAPACAAALPQSEPFGQPRLTSDRPPAAPLTAGASADAVTGAAADAAAGAVAAGPRGAGQPARWSAGEAGGLAAGSGDAVTPGTGRASQAAAGVVAAAAARAGAFSASILADSLLSATQPAASAADPGLSARMALITAARLAAAPPMPESTDPAVMRARLDSAIASVSAEAAAPFAQAGTRGAASADPPAAPAPAAPGDSATPPAVHDQVVRAMTLAWRNGVGEARVQLDPATLGGLTVALRIERGVVDATMTTELAAARDIIEAHARELGSGLAGHGLELGRLVVTADPGRGRREPDTGQRQLPRRQVPSRQEPPVFQPGA
jgi:hypothetical protein